MALRGGGASPGYGLGDMVTNGWQPRGGKKRPTYQTDITGFESHNFRSTTGVAARMVSNFAIHPTRRFGLVNIDPGPKIVVSKDGEIMQGSRHTRKIDALYYFFGTPAEIYAGFLKARTAHGFPVMKPGYDMFGVGWEAWGALAWNTSHQTVMADIDRYLKEGYPLKWAVIGSGFWPQQEERFKATTSFGMWDKEKYPDPDKLKQDFKDRGLRFLVGLRIAFLPDGPFTHEGVEKGYFLMEDGKPRLHTVGFPKAPVYLLDVHNPEAVEWHVNLCDQWGVDGFKEDLYRHETYPLPDDKLDPVNIALKKKGYDIIVRNAYLSSPGSLHRIEDFNYDMNQDRGPVNTLALCGTPSRRAGTRLCPLFTEATEAPWVMKVSMLPGRTPSGPGLLNLIWLLAPLSANTRHRFGFGWCDFIWREPRDSSAVRSMKATGCGAEVSRIAMPDIALFIHAQ